MYWDAVGVTAHVNADGSLSVRERQEYVFDGAWNGGERTFDLKEGQSVDIEALYREDETTGELIPLQAGPIDQVDNFSWLKGVALRWRSRLPTDPPFHKTKRVYVIDMTYHRIMLQDGDRYRLNHDFSFPDRDWDIRKFSLNLTWDKDWIPSQPIAAISDTLLRPGESVVVDARFKYQGSADLNLPVKVVSTSVRGLLLIALAVFCGVALLAMYRSEKSSGLFDEPLATKEIDDAWLQQHVFAYPPEVATAVWRDNTGVLQVSALLARMQLEGKIHGEVTKGVMRLRLLVDLGTLSGYEAKLAEALFVDGNTIDINQLREHYRASGFDPAGIIKRGVRNTVSRLIGDTKKPKLLWLALWTLTGCGKFLFLWELARELGPDLAEFVVTPLAVFTPLLFVALGFLIVLSYRNSRLKLARRILWLFLKLTPLLLIITGVVLLGSNSMSLLAFAGVVLWGAGLFGLVLNFARVREGRTYLEVRRRLDAAQRYLAMKLSQGVNDSQKHWYPYLVGFGLAESVDHWSQGVAGHNKYRSRSSDSDSDSDSSTSDESSSGQTETSAWSGSGGSFGGAGASGHWSSAVADLAHGVSSPHTSSSSDDSSHSSSSSSSSSSRSSSGGGGGGAW